MGRITRMAFIVTTLAALSVPAYAQEETTGPAEQDATRRGASGMRRGAEVTTATFEQLWERTQQPDLQAAGIPDEKIEQLKQMELDTRMALTRGERPDLKALRDKRRDILTPEEVQRISEIRRTRREGAGASPDGVTTGSREETDSAVVETTPTANWGSKQ